MGKAKVSRIYLRGGWYFEIHPAGSTAILRNPDGANLGEWPIKSALYFTEAIYTNASNVDVEEEPSKDLKNVHRHA